MDVRESLERFILAVTRKHLYLAQYECTVEAQHDDDTLDLLPDDERVRGTGCSRVEIKHGLPGVRVRVLTGSRVLLGFVGGEPSKPYASLWSSEAIESLGFNGGTSPVARVGDAVTCYWPASVPFVGTLSGSPFSGTMTITSPSSGVIDSGAARVTA
jgi:hypothetical protein